MVTLIFIYPFPPPFLLDKHCIFFNKSVIDFLCGNMFICVSY